MKKILYLGLLVILFVSGCETKRHIEPRISTPSRTGISLEKPIMISIFDGRTSGTDQSAASSLKAELTRIYGNNLQWTSYFGATPKGRVSLKIRIIELDSTFGSRIISSVSYANAVHNARTTATGPWVSVVGTATGTSNIYGGSFSGEGWWNGAAWLDVEIEDNRYSRRKKITIPLVAEHRESNMFGYSSGDKAARVAWDKVSAQLTSTIDATLKTF